MIEKELLRELNMILASHDSYRNEVVEKNEKKVDLEKKLQN